MHFQTAMVDGDHKPYHVISFKFKLNSYKLQLTGWVALKMQPIIKIQPCAGFIYQGTEKSSQHALNGKQET